MGALKGQQNKPNWSRMAGLVGNIAPFDENSK